MIISSLLSVNYEHFYSTLIKQRVELLNIYVSSQSSIIYRRFLPTALKCNIGLNIIQDVMRDVMRDFCFCTYS